jgi:transcriptional regulator with XRE-family HTH domain
MVTPHGLQGLRDSHEVGAVSGYLLKLARGSIGCRQADLAERLQVDISTVQGWETGRRPLSALKTTDLVRLRNRLSALGTPPVITGLFIDAVEADVLLSGAASSGGRQVPPMEHPLGMTVLRRNLVGLITWPFTGEAPQPLQGLPAPPSRGPVVRHPVLDEDTRNRIFEQMVVAAESAGPDEALLRRQAGYLLGFDWRPDSSEWLNRERTRTMSKPAAHNDMPAAILARSAAIALARQGDPEPVRHYIARTRDSEKHALANLTFWAYWLGEISDTYTSDGDMVATGADAWSGLRLMNHLLTYLSDPVNREINAYSLWTLILSRPSLLERDADLRQRATIAVGTALDGPTRMRRELEQVQVAIRLASR